MTHLIDKSALVAEIKKAIESFFEDNDRIYDEYGNYFYKNADNDYRFYHKIAEDLNWDVDRLSLDEMVYVYLNINTLEVKEVDLETNIQDYINSHFTEGCDGGMISYLYKVLGGVHYNDLKEIAEYFFELGLKVQKGE